MDQSNGNSVRNGQEESEEFLERVAICMFDGGLPEDWAKSVAKISTSWRPEGVLPTRWMVMVDDACKAAQGWWKAFEDNDWSTDDLRGLVPILNGREIVEVGIASVTLNDGSKVHRRPQSDGVAKWDEGFRK